MVGPRPRLLLMSPLLLLLLLLLILLLLFMSNCVSRLCLSFYKDEFIPIYTIKSCRGSTVIAPLILNFSTRRRSTIEFTPPPLYLREKFLPVTEEWAWGGGVRGQSKPFFLNKFITACSITLCNTTSWLYIFISCFVI